MDLTYHKWHPHPDAGLCPDCGRQLGIISECVMRSVAQYHRGTLTGWRGGPEEVLRILAEKVCPSCHRDEYEDVDWSTADGE